MLIPVMRSGQDDPALVPNDLLRIKKIETQQAIQDFACVERCVPHVSDLQTRHKLERFRPIGSRVGGNRGVLVADSPMLHVAGFGWAFAIEPGAITPFGIERDSVGRIGDH
jgi:hypothetical protein